MDIGFKSQRNPQILEIKVQTRVPCKMVLRVRDWKKPYTFYTNREMNVSGKQTFLVRMPQSPEVGVIEVYNKRNGNLPKGQDKTFMVSSLNTKPLTQKLNVWSTRNNNAKNFIKFAQEFSERASILSSTLPDGASVYRSDDGKFTIKYFDVITDRVTGKPLRTPSRISQTNGTIEVAKKYFVNYTVPMRMAILLHEYSHFYLNENPRDEMQADKNALLVYCGLGYPAIDAMNAWLEVFKGTPSDQNVNRFEAIKKFMADFEKRSYKLK